MNKFIVTTELSKSFGRATADALDDGRFIFSVARSSPEHFSGEFIESGLGDPRKTEVCATKLVGHDQVPGIVNSFGLAKHDTIGTVDPRGTALITDDFADERRKPGSL